MQIERVNSSECAKAQKRINLNVSRSEINSSHQALCQAGSVSICVGWESEDHSDASLERERERGPFQHLPSSFYTGVQNLILLNY